MFHMGTHPPCSNNFSLFSQFFLIQYPSQLPVNIFFLCYKNKWEKKVILLKSWFLDPNRIVWSDPVNRELLIIPILLILRTFFCEKKHGIAQIAVRPYSSKNHGQLTVCMIPFFYYILAWNRSQPIKNLNIKNKIKNFPERKRKKIAKLPTSLYFSDSIFFRSSPPLIFFFSFLATLLLEC